MKQYTYQLKVRSEKEMELLERRYREQLEEIRDNCKRYGVGEPNLSGVKYPDKLYVERTEIATGTKSSANISDCTCRTIYPLLTSFRPEKSDIDELHKYLNTNMTYEELNLLLKAAQDDGIQLGTVADIFTPLTKYVEVKSIANYNAMKSRAEHCNLDDMVRVCDEMVELQKMMTRTANI